MKNPNGYGTVVKLSGNRRNPYAARKTIGFNEKGYPIYKFIGFTKTKEEALIMLAEYNHSPYDIDTRKKTVKEIFDMWYRRDIYKMSKSSAEASKAAWKHCESVYNMKYINLKAYHMQDCIDRCKLSYSSKRAIKNLFVHLDRFAMEMDIIVKRNSELICSPSAPESKKTPFTAEEINRVWDIKDKEWTDSILVFLYMGWRISELLNIRKSDVNIDDGIIVGGIKTVSGKNRIVPIHDRIMPFIKKRYENENEYLFGFNGRICSKSKYYSIWKNIMNEVGITHTPHECRHTFRSRLDSAGANKVCIDMLMGHKSAGIGERIYTHKTIDELRDAINLLN